MKFCPTVLSEDDHWHHVASNLVASARFLHFMISCFIEHVLGVGSNHPGLFEEIAAYYGTIEQQGHLTLHLHLLLWIKGSFSPDEMQRRILDPTSKFRHDLINYLEKAHIGEFMVGTCDGIIARVEDDILKPSYVNPCKALLSPPPKYCKEKCGTCSACNVVESWWTYFKSMVDHILALSNIHTCTSTLKKDGTHDKCCQYLCCLDNIWGKCKAHFP
jgi:hypothetical protein